MIFNSDLYIENKFEKFKKNRNAKTILHIGIHGRESWHHTKEKRY